MGGGWQGDEWTGRVGGGVGVGGVDVDSAAMSEPTGPGSDDPRGPVGPGTSTSVLERTELREELEPGDRERFAHYVRKEKILASAMSGNPVVALCGKVWVPGRDPNKFPVCPVCKEIYEGLRDPQDGDQPSGGGPAGGSGGSSGGR